METRKIADLKPHPLNAEIYGDACDAELRDSVRAKGVLTPVIITSARAEIGGNVIISGHRRVNAAQMARHAEIPVVISDLTSATDIEEAVITLNTQRQKSNEQIGREFAKLRQIEAERARVRQATSGPGILGGKPLPERVPERVKSNGDARDVAASKLGVSGKHAERAAKVVEVIDSLKEQGQTEQAEKLRGSLDKSVSAAYREAKPVITKPVTEEAKLASRPTFNETNDNIEWAKWSWNPVTGCKHGCPYCYARDIAHRFTGHFNPEFHPERLDAPLNTKIPEGRRLEPGIHNVFVCSMADLFGEWVPKEWIDQVMDSVMRAPRWTFLFLTKNPDRYLDIKFPPNVWLGVTADTQERASRAMDVFSKIRASSWGQAARPVLFLSAEPLSERICLGPCGGGESHPVDWLIIGGRSRTSGMEAGQPEWAWVEDLILQARQYRIPMYFKENLTVRPKEYPEG